jgi:hypothetical protein
VAFINRYHFQQFTPASKCLMSSHYQAVTALSRLPREIEHCGQTALFRTAKLPRVVLRATRTSMLLNCVIFRARSLWLAQGHPSPGDSRDFFVCFAPRSASILQTTQ